MKKNTLILFILILILSVISGCTNNKKKSDFSYKESIFDASFIHTIEITMDEEDRKNQLANPEEKTRYEASVTIDGEKLDSVSFSTKGNSSLHFPVAAGKNKYSYRLAFNGNDKNQTYHGLDKLSLQNNFSDATYMRNYLAYYLFNKMGVSAPLASYVTVSINGEYQGLYTAVEYLDKSFLNRTNEGTGTLYKPELDSLDLNKDGAQELAPGSNAARDDVRGADLVYIDDNEENYPDIFENNETKEDPETRTRVIKALKALNEQKELDKYIDTDEIIRYFAVHNYLVNYDSYTGLMLHNYYLYEKKGKLAMLPWDYDSCFGSFSKDAIVGSNPDSEQVINTGIDSPLSDVPQEKRPMWNFIRSDETYLKQYHEELAKIISIVESEEFKKEVQRINDLISPYIKEEPLSYFTNDEHNKAYETMKEFIRLRSESVKKQLEGSLSSISEDQKEENRINAADISIRDMGRLPMPDPGS